MMKSIVLLKAVPGGHVTPGKPLLAPIKWVFKAVMFQCSVTWTALARLLRQARRSVSIVMVEVITSASYCCNEGETCSENE